MVKGRVGSDGLGDSFDKLRLFIKKFIRGQKKIMASPLVTIHHPFRNKLFLTAIKRPNFYLELLNSKEGIPLIKTGFYLHVADRRAKDFFSLFYSAKRKKNIEFKKYFSSSYYFSNIFNKLIVDNLKKFKLANIFFKTKIFSKKRKKSVPAVKGKVSIFPSYVKKLDKYLSLINSRVMGSHYFSKRGSKIFNRRSYNNTRPYELLRIINTSTRKYLHRIYSRKFLYIYHLKILFYSYFYKFLPYINAPNFFIVMGAPGRGPISARFIVDMVLTKLEQKYKIGVII
jgi:hypothetical protein